MKKIALAILVVAILGLALAGCDNGTGGGSASLTGKWYSYALDDGKPGTVWTFSGSNFTINDTRDGGQMISGTFTYELGENPDNFLQAGAITFTATKGWIWNEMPFTWTTGYTIGKNNDGSLGLYMAGHFGGGFHR